MLTLPQMKTEERVAELQQTGVSEIQRKTGQQEAKQVAELQETGQQEAKLQETV